MKNSVQILILMGTVAALMIACDDSGNKNTNAFNLNNQNNLNNINNLNNNTQPAIFSVAPARGPLTGGTEITIYGNRFAEDAAVTIGGVSAGAVNRISASALSVHTPAGNATGPADVRVSQTGGEATLVGGFIYEDSQATDVSWCVFQFPTATSTVANSATEPLFGRVFAEGVTTLTGRGEGITAQVGYGTAGSDPSTDPSWIWVQANYHMDSDDGANDEYFTSLTPTTPGTFDMAFRFSGGGDWIYCDTDGSDNGYAPDRSAELTVTEATDPMPDWCTLQFPAKLEGQAGVTLGPVFGRVFKAGVTVGPGAGSALVGELGFGPVGSHPGTDPGWQWVLASYNTDVDQHNNDEYQANLTFVQPGEYAYAYRFSYQDGPWLYCDLNGSSDGYGADFAGLATVDGTATETAIDWCTLQYPLETNSLIDEPTTLLFGRVFIDGITNGTGAGQGILGQVGYGPTASDPATSGDWTWVDAAYNIDADGPVIGDRANDEYMAKLTVSVAGDYAFAYRFSRDGGTTWHACDGDGSINGYDPAEAGLLHVTEAPVQTVDWCVFQYPTAAQNLIAGVASDTLYGRVYVSGVTDGAGQGTGVTAQFGYGPAGTDPANAGAGWSWTSGTYHVSVDGLMPGGLANDEYSGAVTINTAGQYALAVRFSRDAGASWTVCDTDGSENGVQPNLLTAANVTSGTSFQLVSINPTWGPVAGNQTVTLTGTGFATGMTVSIGGSTCGNVQVIGPTSATCVTTARATVGPSTVAAALNTDNVSLTDAYYYAPYMTPTLNGDLAEWTAVYSLGTNAVVTDWGATDELNGLFFAYDDARLYLAFDGGSALGNAVILYLDTDYGAGTGVRTGSSLSDNSGELDNAVSGAFSIGDAQFGAEWAVGTKSMTVKTLGSYNDMSGLRNIAIDSSDFAWYDQEEIAVGTQIIEIAIPFNVLGISTGTSQLAVFALISDWSGQSYCNQSLPSGIAAGVLSNVIPITIVK